MTDLDEEPELTAVQIEYNIAQGELFQLAAWGRDSYHRTGELLSVEGNRQHAEYRDAIHRAQARFEAAVLDKAAADVEQLAFAEEGPATDWNWWDAATIPGSVGEFLRDRAKQIREEQC